MLLLLLLQSSSLTSRIPVPWLTVLVTQTECVSSRPSAACRYNVYVSVSESNDAFAFIYSWYLVHVRVVTISDFLYTFIEAKSIQIKELSQYL